MAKAVCTACGQEFTWDHLGGVKLAFIPSPCCNAKAKGKTVRGPVNKRIGIMMHFQRGYSHVRHPEWTVPYTLYKPRKALFTPTDDGLIFSDYTRHARPDPTPVTDKQEQWRILRPIEQRASLIYRIKESDFQALEALRRGVK